MTATLGSPLRLHFSGREARNRFCKAATTERMSTWDPTDRSKSGILTDEVIRLHRRWGEGEIGIIVTGAMTVDPAYLEAPGNAIIDVDSGGSGEQFTKFEQFAQATKAHGSLLLGQLNHTGRQTMALLNPDPVSASEVKLEQNEMGLEYGQPHAASLGEIAGIKKTFAKGAAYLEAAGFDGVQLNAAHGYLISQFLSPTTNQRDDEYGASSLENRARFLLEIVRDIRATCAGSFIVSVKLNCVEYQSQGTSLDDVKTVCSWLEEEKVDIIELSGGTYQEFGWKHKAPYTDEKREGYFLRAADTIRPVLTNTRLYATGGFHTTAAMKEALKVVDGIGIARGFCQEPDLVKKILNGGSEGRSVQCLDQGNYQLTCLLAGTQMRELSQGKMPSDGSRQDVADAFMQKIGLWIADMTNNNPNGTKYGWMDIDNPVST